MPTSPVLIKWMCDKGYAEAQRYMKERAVYGSLMHYAIGMFITTLKWDFDKVKDFVDLTITEGITEYCKEGWHDDLNSDIAAFAQFVCDYKVKPMAVEIVLVSKDGYATLIDLVCKMTIQEDGLHETDVLKSGPNKGQPKKVKVDKEITALMNFKSGRHGFFDEHEIQLEFEKRLFQENYPEIKIDAIYNWAPKEWRKSPTYTLKDQSDSLNAVKAEALLAIARIELIKKLPNSVVIEGIVPYGTEPVVGEYGVYDIVRNRHKETKVK
ncbi:MAG TPA: hypothetical protein PLU58_07345 [Saprospiraceae bacterium]|nr:hypothetical protein [Saprospiraceae bacterium]